MRTPAPSGPYKRTYPRAPRVWQFTPNQIACIRCEKNHTSMFYRVLAIDGEHTVVREIAMGWHDETNTPLFVAIAGTAKDYHDIIPLELPTAAELRELRLAREDVPADTPTVENH